ncbi:MAG: HAD-IB family phosphatase [Alphaproteobacteria bacterium]|nr:HAD-IB family phosphatase [Alphaproteobacteria bacterium]
MLQKVNVVIFDFDGTLSAKDSNFEFFKYCFKHSFKPWLFLPWIIIIFGTSIFNYSGVWWRQMIRFFLTKDMIERYSQDFTQQHKKNRFKWVKKQVALEKKRGNKVVLISASPDFLILPLVDDICFDAILTSVTNKTKPWKYDFLCYEKNKVYALDKWANENKYIPKVIRTYSDSISDMPIMQIAQEQVWINKKTGTRI